MSKITTFRRSKQRFYSNEKSSNAIKIVDDFGNETFHHTLSDDYFTNFLDRTYSDKVESGLLPPGVRAIYPGNIVFERPPSMQMIQYVPMNVESIIEYEEEQDESPDVQTFYIPVPWQVYIASYSMSNGAPVVNGVKMFFTNEPLTHSEVKLYLPYVPNFFTNGTLCPPHFEDLDEIYRYPSDISGIIASAYDWVWNTGFNQDLIDGVMTNINAAENSIITYIRQNPSHDLVSSFYKYISQYTPEEINEFTWVHPSYTSYHSDSTEIRYLYTLDELRQQCVQDLDIIMDCDDDQDISNFEDYVSLSDFNEWIGNIYHITKTYSDVCYSIFLDQNNPTEKHSNHRLSFKSATNISVTQNHFVNSLQSYVRNLPV